MKRYFPLTAAFMATALAADIPVHQVVLYKSGVGYFERTGMLARRIRPLGFQDVGYERRAQVAHHHRSARR